MSKRIGHDDKWEDLRRWAEDQPKSRFVIAALILLAICYVVFGFGYDQNYNEEVETEKKLAMLICENSRDWILADLSRLKHGNADLKQVKVQGRTIELKHVKYPKVLFLDSGIRNLVNKSTANDLYCYFEDPRSTSLKYYYNYKTDQWVDKVRFHR